MAQLASYVLSLVFAIFFLNTVQSSPAHGGSGSIGGNDPLGGMPKRCRELKPGNSSYEPLGSRVKFGDIEIYETGDAVGKRLLIVAYDIFGFHPHTFKIADMMAADGGFRVVVPDYFKGEPFSMEKFPPHDHMEDLINFLSTKGSWDLHAREITKNVLAHYKNEGFQHIGMYGTCWGGKIAFLTGAEMENDVNAVASIHGFNLTMVDVEDVGVPVYLIPAMDDPDASPYFKVLEERFGNKCGHTRMEDVEHGYFAARADFNDPVNAKRIEETKSILIKFFSENMK